MIMGNAVIHSSFGAARRANVKEIKNSPASEAGDAMAT